MDPSVAIQFIVLIVLLLLSAFFSSAETSLVTVNQIRMRSLADEGNKKAARVLKITSNSSKMLSAILIGNNIVNIFASSLATTITLQLWGNRFVSLTTGILTLLVLIFGEITPKTIATSHAEKIAMTYSGVISLLIKVLTPVIFIINKLANGFLFILGLDPGKKAASITEDELRTIVDVSHEEGVIEKEERQMIKNVFDFGDSQAKDVMIPRIDMTCVSIDSRYDEIISVFRTDKYTRLPVYEDSVDNVIGIINVKDLLLCEDKASFNVRDILRKPYYTYEFKKTSELMEELKKTSNNFTIVIDEYGSTVGMITLEDLLEEIVGEIRDEYDGDEVDDIIKVNDTEYIFSGTARLNDIEEYIELPDIETDHESDYDSISGFIIDSLKRLPVLGDEVTIGNLRFVVEGCTKNRITKVHAYILDTKKEPDEENTENRKYTFMKKIIKEFKEFISKGNIFDMAIGLIVGSAFTAIVNSLVGDIFSPLLTIVTSKADLTALAWNINGAQIKYGSFLQAIITFLLTAIVLFFLVKGINKLRSLGQKKGEEKEAAPTTKICPFCRSEIDLEATRCPHCTSELEK